MLETIVKAIVDKSDEVSINVTETENTQIYELRVGDGDVGMVIGKHGKKRKCYSYIIMLLLQRLVVKDRFLK